MVLTDVKKEHDKVCHSGLTYELLQIGIENKLLLTRQKSQGKGKKSIADTFNLYRGVQILSNNSHQCIPSAYNQSFN